MLETVNLTCNGLKSRTLVKVQKFSHSPRTPVLNEHGVFMYNICPRVMQGIREFKINDATAATTPQNLHT